MPYREKIAWLMLISIVVTFGPYFVLVWSGYVPEQPMPNLPQLLLYAIAAVARVVIIGVGYLYLRHSSKQDARLPLDERDLAIKYRAMSFAYYVLIAGMIQVGCFMPFISDGGWAIVNAALFMIATSELVSHSVVIYSYRRQA